MSFLLIHVFVTVSKNPVCLNPHPLSILFIREDHQALNGLRLSPETEFKILFGIMVLGLAQMEICQDSGNNLSGIF